jgi:hypothetical protein
MKHDYSNYMIALCTAGSRFGGDLLVDYGIFG